MQAKEGILLDKDGTPIQTGRPSPHRPFESGPGARIAHFGIQRIQSPWLWVFVPIVLVIALLVTLGALALLIPIWAIRKLIGR